MTPSHVEVWTTPPNRSKVVLVGHLYPRRDRGVESATFRYAASWLELSGSFAIDPQLPLLSGTFATTPGQKLFGAFTDSAPDRWGCELTRRAERRRAALAGGTPRSFGEADFLLDVSDRLRQGALRLRDSETGMFLASDDDSIPALLDLPRLLTASDKLERDLDTDEDLRLLLRAGSSLGGARPKASVITADGRLQIAKFPRAGSDTWNVMAWEKVALDLAAAAGIRVPAARLERVATGDVLLVDRFDRNGSHRIGYVSAMTLLEAQDGDRRSYLELADALAQRSPTAARDLSELWTRVALSILISNTDDHPRNHGFLLTDGGWELSPVFDLNPDPDGARFLSMAIDFDDARASVDTLMAVAPEFRLDPATTAPSQLRKVYEATADWAGVARRNGLSEAEIERLSPAFEHDQRTTARSYLT